MTVDIIVATSSRSDGPTPNTSAKATVSVRPARTTFAQARNRGEVAGRSRSQRRHEGLAAEALADHRFEIRVGSLHAPELPQVALDGRVICADTALHSPSLRA